MCPIRSSAVTGEPREQTGNGRSAAGAARDATSTTPVRPRPLVVVSNRLPFAIAPRTEGARVTRAPGGLVSALEPALAERGGLWIGWDGLARDAGAPPPQLPAGPAGVRYLDVPLSAREVAAYYSGFSNGTLWPLFHYFVSRARIDAPLWRAYDRVNERFARAAAEASPPGALLWIHDYQLLRVPHHLRRLSRDNFIGFFLHIPFPAADVFRVLPWSRELMRGMLAADLVGFQIPAYAEHFLTCAEQLLACDVDRVAGVARFEGRAVRVEVHPINIDAGQIERLAARPAEPALPGRPTEIIGVDRLDYTKGIAERLLAVERLLDRHPEFRQRIRFTQVLVPSRERVADYSELKREIDETVGRINGRYSDHGWSPIRYFVRALPPEELVPLYRSADIALVTPLRDGMNLVAKEYVAAHREGDGVLVLSELAGAAVELQEALVVNPFDLDAVAGALHRALTMPEDERRARMSALRDRVRAHDVHAWVRDFLGATETAAQRARDLPESPADQVRRRLVTWLAARPTASLLLDYDGTLTPLVERPEAATLSDAAREVLQQAAARPSLDVAVVSGRALEDLRRLVGIPGLTYVGNHGFEIEGPGIAYRHPGSERYLRSLEQAAAELEGLGVPGARVERKGPTLSFHLRTVPAPEQHRAAQRAMKVLKRARLRVTEGAAVIEGRPPVNWHKGHAVLYVLTRRHGADWPARVRPLYIGDDVTDEDAFRSLRGIGRSIAVGPVDSHGPAVADYWLPDPAAVLQLVRWLAAGAFATSRP